MIFKVIKQIGLIALFGAIFCFGPAAFSSAAQQEKEKISIPKPDNHSAGWIELHGRTVEPGAQWQEHAEKSCYACHEKNDCIVCHNTRPPRDHTSTWRSLSHGFQAAGNRERCGICHRQDYCVRCHRETAPRTHRGNWNGGRIAGAPDKPGHCTWCHFSSGTVPADNCVVCHRRAPHPSAPHVVNGADCALCH